MVQFPRQLLLYVFFISAEIINPNHSFTQEISPPEIFIAPKIKRAYTKDPKILSSKLTEGLASDKEKFDALFSWVVTNIQYNYKTLNSGKGIPELRLKKVLRNRKGVCTDYARLMDSLCLYAGLTSVSIDGYTKGTTFDVNDSLYFDNHTWNGVKLNNYWYLYDATWSSGRNAYELTRFGIWRDKQLDKLLLHARIEPHTLRIRKKKNKLCGLEGGTELATSTVRKLPTPYRQLYWLIDLFPYRYKTKYRGVYSANYYLTHPDLLVLNHFPNDPMWSLSTTVRTLDEFRMDSTFYYGIQQQFHSQQREGRICIECDDFLAYHELKQAKEQIKRAKEYLPQNPFEAARAEMKVATTYYKEFAKEKDSIAKMNLFDSTVFYLKQSRTDFSASRKPASREYLYHSKKNKDKRNFLAHENKQKQRLYNSTFKAIQSRQQKIRSLIPKANAYNKRIRSNRRIFLRSFSYSGSPITKEDRILVLQADLQKALRNSDSLQILVGDLRVNVVHYSIELWKGLLNQNDLWQPLNRFYNSDSYLRSTVLMDSYDREIRLIRSNIDTLEHQFQDRIQFEILNHSDSVFRLLKQLHQTSLKRDTYAIRAAKAMTKLNRCGIYSKDDLLSNREIALECMKEDICWKEDHAELFKVCSFQFKKFHEKSRFFKLMISRNTKDETKRHKRIQQIISITKSRLYDAVRTNNLVIQKMRKKADLERKKFLDARKK